MNSRMILMGILLIVTIGTSHAQSYIGLLEDNYNGVHGIISNPANIADSKLKTDINLFGASSFVGNNYVAFNLGDAFSDMSNAFDNAATFPSKSNFIGWNIDVLGPSVMLSLSKKHSFSFFTRARAFFNLNDANGELLDKEGGFDESEDFFLDEGNISGAFNLWAEIGATYARVLLDNEQHFIKGGLSLKYIQGMGNVYIHGSDITVDYDSGSRQVATTGLFNYGNTASLDDEGNGGNYFDFNGGAGIGTDIGFVYEWRPEYAKYTKKDVNGNPIVDRGTNKYKLKFGASITDIGKINDVSGVDRFYDLNETQDIDNFDGDVLEEALLDNFHLISETESVSVTLPTALHTNVDWNITSRLYLNLNADMPLTSKEKINTNRVLNQFRLTPRFESTWLGIYSPLSILEGAGFQWGAGLRLGPIYLGSGSIISAIAGKNTKAIDVFAGLKIPVYQNRLKDKDNDGIINQEDQCPEVAGPIENKGCPWKDTDGDGILDKDDDCPNEAGPTENKGCPWKDTDGDAVLDKDDHCPTEVGLKEYNGCPDTDGDGIIDGDDRCPATPGSIEHKGCPDTDGDTLADIDDECPDIAGPVSNNGCPEVTQEVQKQLNDYARTILFDTGKATIKSESLSTMVDIIQILNEYPNAKFTVEGHTDSVGSSESNQRLSEARANSVRDFLINEGIASDRLSAIGFGEEKPIATNSTRIGRQQNRRVEINLIK
ncbi:DUF5723 family protein [Allomuricauda sp. CP2A]|jgi:outer membrane protein OmpA-like peptidoglycan-associated protein|uniref:DUF5723 family protein n=1 Tax=Allomuricauda sp. CP2A TaxID=1848189 RepID=UPI00083189A3|nr:DUF5723 family protein [Muricauda sp. CP2A]